ncbi:hypothetical protein CKO38_01910 [Rhodospirillum rubrum]|uniref:DUF4258 domain-containing protein n=1 Tax=Rhodospirillum rubrum TaxID=1085 RepID=UPI001902F211|nr:DUF4258 domain-containing protein [Rhodospirillum rubrum]MBK1663989.1 hypothetical protein [Rhodospirillum rubrum]MBK1675453.1 hypothetical protein [Rhodospirillum rubrum]
MLGHHDETRRLHALATNPGTLWEFRAHAQDEMRKDGITKPDVQTVLRRSAVVKVEQARFEETWLVHGKDCDERTLEIVVVAYEDVLRIKIITAWTR